MLIFLPLLSCHVVSASKNLRAPKTVHRDLNAYYHTLTTTTLGAPNPDAAIGNSLKGLAENPVYTNPPYKADIPLSVEFYYLGKELTML